MKKELPKYKKYLGIILIAIGILLLTYGFIDFAIRPPYVVELNTIYGIIITSIPIFIGIYFLKAYNKTLNPIVKCKFCKSEIDSTARVCPVCHRTLSISLAATIVTIFIAYIIFRFFILPLLII